MNTKSCVLPTGKFSFGIHKPAYAVRNLRQNNYHACLGEMESEVEINNTANFPEGTVEELCADWIFEIPNPFPFRGTTYIARRWAEEKVGKPETINLPQPKAVSLFKTLKNQDPSASKQEGLLTNTIRKLPEPLQIALASTSTDPNDLVALANICCEFVFTGSDKLPRGLKFSESKQGNPKPVIHNRPLFEVLANNPHLPNEYKEAMVLRPGVQGSSEIVGEWLAEPESHIFEYLRRNSYIPWGHYAANMANNAVRYQIADLSLSDMTGLRHLYYQRTFIRLAEMLELKIPPAQKTLNESELEVIRRQILEKCSNSDEMTKLPFNRTLWGWNFGFDYAPSHYRLHASHQQIHQQFAMIPGIMPSWQEETDDDKSVGNQSPFACGDLIEDFIENYKTQTGQPFFESYIKALKNNKRTDGRGDQPQELIIHNRDDVIVFVPKAQTSQWELQIMPLRPVGNIVEADSKTRSAINLAMFVAVNILAELGAKMITSIEFSKRIDGGPEDQRLLYSLLPKLPESPGAFSEAQLRWINGHYPEDFAAACQLKLSKVLSRLGD